MFTVLSESPAGSISSNKFAALETAQQFAAAHKYASRVYYDDDREILQPVSNVRGDASWPVL